MGNITTNSEINCKQRCSELIDDTKSQIYKFNPFSKIQPQLPYAQPLETNQFAPNLIIQQLFDKIVESEPLKAPASFDTNQSYEYDQKYWKKQQPNIVIQGHWFKRKPHGLCKIFFPGGQTLFISYFNHGKPLFQDCLIIFDNGSYYHGSLRNYKFDGAGKYVHFDKNVIIEGEWKNGRPVGQVNEKIINNQQLIEFQGQFNSQSEKQGQKCTYSIKNSENQKEKLFEYNGGFKSDQFFGKGSIKTKNGQIQMSGMFKKNVVEVEKLETEEFQFTGEMDKLLKEGNGKVKIKRPHRNIVCQGSLKNWMLNGPGTIINEDGQLQKVYWFNGIKLKHVRNHDNPAHLNQILERIEMHYGTAKTYSQMTKQLLDHFKGHQIKEIPSSKTLQYSYIFEMITREKASIITSSTKQLSNQTQSQSSPSKTPSKKQLIIELQKGKFLYVNCFPKQSLSSKDMK